MPDSVWKGLILIRFLFYAVADARIMLAYDETLKGSIKASVCHSWTHRYRMDACTTST